MPKRLVIIAGEESGDAHAAELMLQLKKSNEDIQISGIGGKHMQEAGAKLISDLARFGVTGFSEVIRHIRVIKKAFADIKLHLKQHKPDLLILVDYPGFNLRLAKYAKEVLGIRILYYISPQIWAWKGNRIHAIKRYVDHMAVILPFEKQIYQQAGIPVSFVGHPLTEKIDYSLHANVSRLDLHLPQNKKIIALLPGSRVHEIERHMPVLIETAKRLSKQIESLHFAIPIARTIDPEQITPYLKDFKGSYTLIPDQALETVNSSDFCIVASGTASLECALLIKPMCIIYRASRFTYLAATKLIKTNYLGLCNLLENSMIVPELLQYDCNPHELTKLMTDLIKNKNRSEQMRVKLRQLKHNLSAAEADLSLADLVLSELATLPSKKS